MGKVTIQPMAGPDHPIYTGELFVGARITDSQNKPAKDQKATTKPANKKPRNRSKTSKVSKGD